MLEATIIVMDNSESSRNGDYTPTRFGAQADAVNLIYNAKTNANPESSVGLMTMAGSGPEVLTTLTTDMGKILDGIHRTKIKGTAHFSTAINIAALALKHRQNKSQKQRVVVFTCSPISEDEKTIVKLAKKMKKSNINIDIIAFGDPDNDTEKKLREFHEQVKSAEGSFFEIIPPGPNLLSDTLVSTSLLANDGVGGTSGGSAGGDGGMGEGQYEFGVNPEIDPELALALRMSFAEEEARKAKEKKAQEEAEAKTKLDDIPEGDEKQPLLPKDEDKDKKSDDKEQDKMDTA